MADRSLKPCYIGLTEVLCFPRQKNNQQIGRSLPIQIRTNLSTQINLWSRFCHKPKLYCCSQSIELHITSFIYTFLGCTWSTVAKERSPLSMHSWSNSVDKYTTHPGPILRTDLPPEYKLL